MPQNLVFCGRSLRTLAIAFGFFLVTEAAAFSAPITYTFSGTLSGSVGGTPFVNAPVTIVAVGDSSTVASGGGIYCNNLSSVTVVGGTSVPLTDTFSIFDNTAFGNAGLFRGSCGAYLFDWFRVGNSQFNTYNLATAIGPLSVTPTYTDTTDSVNSAAGTVILSGQALTTFQATVGGTVSAIPTLSEWGLIGFSVGLAVLGFFTLRNHAA